MSNDLWQTPPYIIEMARKVMGSIDFDPASSREANLVVGAENFYQISDKTCVKDGLTNPWPDSCNIFMNPPFSRGNPGGFVSRLEDWWYRQPSGESQCIAVFNNDSETLWCQKAFHLTSSTCFPKGRISFIDPIKGKPANNNRQGQVIFYLGFNDNKFCAEFGKLGFVV